MADPKIPSALLPNEDYSKVAGTYDDQLTVNKLEAERAYAKAAEAGLRKVVGADGKVAEVDDDTFSTAILSGDYKPAEGEQLTALDAEGNTYQFSDLNSFRDSISSGKFRTETVAEAAQRELNTKYQNSTAEAFAAGAAEGVSIVPLASIGAAATGNYGEYEALKEQNPIASGLGEAAGFIGGAFLTGGTSALAKGAGKLTTLAATEAIEKAAVNKLSKSLVKEGAKEAVARSMAQRVLGYATEKSVPYAISGAALGLKDSLTEQAFGDAPFNAEAVISGAANGALLGGIFGLGGSLAVDGAKAMAPKAKKLLETVTEASVGKPWEAALNYLGSGKKVFTDLALEGTEKAARHQSEIVTATREFIDWTEKRGLKVGNDVEKNAAWKAWKDDVGSRIGDRLKDADELYAKANGKKFAIKETDLISKEMDALQTEYSKLAAERGADSNVLNYIKKEISDRAAVIEAKNKLAPFTAELESGAAKQVDKELSMSDIFKSDVTTRKQINFASPEWEKKGADIANKVTSDTLRGIIEQGLASSGMSKKAMKLGEYLGDLNVQYKWASKLEKGLAQSAAAESKAVGKSGVTSLDIIGTGALMGATGSGLLATAAVATKKLLEGATKSDAARKLAIMGTLERSHAKLARSMDNFVSKVTVPGSIALGAANAAIISNLSVLPISNKIVDGKIVKPKDENEAYVNLVNNVREQASKGEALMQDLNRGSAAMFEHAPETASQMDITNYAAIQYLNTISSSKKTKKPGSLDFGKMKTPSSFDLSKMRRATEAIFNTHKVLESGHLSKDHINAIKSVYPQLFNKLQEKTMKSLQKQEKLDYKTKLRISALFNTTGDESLESANVLALQSNFNEQQSQSEPGVKYSAARVDKVEKAGRIESDLNQETEA